MVLGLRFKGQGSKVRGAAVWVQGWRYGIRGPGLGYQYQGFSIRASGLEVQD